MGEIKHGPMNFETGLPLWVIWNKERFFTPQMSDIERLVMDSVSETLDGQAIEPDGIASNGCPSWPLALGLI
jgi:hypothetical protein